MPAKSVSLLFLLNILFVFQVFSQTTSLSFTAIPISNADLNAPGRGVEQWHDQNLVNVPVEGTNTQRLDVYYRFVWTQIEGPTLGSYSWTFFDGLVNQAITKKQKFSFGIMQLYPGGATSNGLVSFDGGLASYPLYLHTLMQAETVKDWRTGTVWTPNYNSLNYQNRLLALYQAIDAHIKSTSFNGVPYRNVIGCIDIRGYGAWGEWHSGYTQNNVISDYPAGTFPTVASLKKIVDAHTQGFPDFPLVAMIAAFDANWLQNTMNPPEIAHYVLTQRNNWGLIGWRRDQWGATDSYIASYLENNTRSFNGLVFRDSIMVRWKSAPITGEPPGWVPSNYSDLERQIRLYHATSFGNGNYGTTSPTTTIKNAIRASSKACGYRLIIEGGSLTTACRDISLTLNWKNTGQAPTYENWDVMLELKNGSGVVAWTGTSQFKPRLFQPLTNATAITDNFSLPANLPGGTYTLNIIVRDPTGYRDPLPLAINGINADKSYTLSQVTIGAGSPGITVANNCGNSVLTATGYTGSLLWNTGATTPSITVNTAGTYSVTQTLNSCTSAPASAVAAPGPSSVPPPTVTVINNCGNSVLTASDYTGSLLWSTGAATESITVTSNSTYTVRQTLNNCTSPDGIGVAAPKPIPALNIPLSTTAGSGTPFTFLATSTTPGTSFTWSRSAVAGISNLAATGTGNVDETLVNITASPVVVTYVYTLSANGCTNTQNVLVTVGVDASIVAPAMTSQPTPQTKCAGDNVTFSSDASGGPVPTVQWQQSTNNGNSWNNIGGATSSTLSFTTTTADNGKQYRAVWTNIAGTATSSAATLTVNSIPSAPTVAVINNCGSSLLTATGTSGAIFSWSNSETGNSITVAAGDYTATQRVNGCTSAPSIIATAAPKAVPIEPSVSVTNNCGTSLLTASGDPGATFTWSIGAPANPITVASAGNYTVTQTVNGCTGPSASATASPKPVPVLTSSVTAAATSSAVFSYTASSTVSATTFTWSRAAVAGISNSANNGTGDISETLVNTTASPVIVTYVYTLTTADCSNTQNVQVTVSVDGSTVAPTVTTQPASQTWCAGGLATFSSGASGGPAPTVQWQDSPNGNTWSNIPGATSSTLSFTTTTADNNKRYRAVWTNIAGTVNSNAAILTVNAIPGAPSISTANNCGSSVLSAPGGTGITYLWSTGETTNSITVPQGDYTVTQTINGCTGPAANVTANPKLIPAAPGVSVTDNCGSSLLTASGDPGATYLWSTGATTQSTNVTIASNYTVRQTVNGCQSAASNPAEASPKPVPALSNSLTTSATSSAVFTYAATSSTSGTTFTWSRAAVAGISNSANNGTGDISETLVNTTASPVIVTYVYTLTTADCSNTQNVQVTVSVDGSTVAPTVTTQPASQTWCAGGLATFSSGASGGPAPTVQWQDSPNGNTWSNIPGATSSTLSFTTTTADNNKRYRAVWTNIAGTVNSNAAILTVNAIPSAPSISTTNNCGSSVLSAPGGTGITYLWNTGETTNSITVPQGDYTVTQTVNGCTGPAANVTANPKLIPSAPGVSVTDNCGSSLLTASGDPGATYLWSTGATTQSTNVTIASNYTVRQTVNGCQSAASNPAAASPKPVPALSNSLTTSATSSSLFTYSATSSTSGTSFTWSRAAVAGISNSANNGTGDISETLVNTTASPVIVTYVYTLTTADCSNTQNVQVTVSVDGSTVAPTVTTQPASQTWCAGGLATFSSGASGGPAPTVQWQDSPNGNTWSNIPGATSSTLSFTTTTADNNKRYRAVWTNIAGTVNSNAAILTVNAIPSAPSISTTNNCGSSVLSAPGGTGITYLWSTGETTNSITVPQGDYTVTQTINGCTGPAANVTANPKLIPAAPGVSVTDNCGSSLLTASGDPGATYLWSTGATTQSTNVTIASNYTVRQTVNGCQSAASNPAEASPKPVPALSNSLTTSATSSAVFTYAATSSTSGTTFTWSRAAVAGISNPANNGTGDISETLVNTTASPVIVTYVYTLTTADCSNTQNVQVTVSVDGSTVAPTVTTQPASQTWCAGGLATFSSGASGGPAPTVQWQDSPNGNTWSNIPGATSSTLSFTTTTADNNKRYRAVWTNIAGTVNSNAAILTVNAVPILSSSLTANATSGSAFSYTATSSTSGTSFAWSRAAVTGISNAAANGSGNISETLINTTTSPVNVTYAYTLTANGCTNSQNVIVAVNFASPTITTQPGTQTRCAGVTASFTSAASGSPAPTVQWQVSTNGGTSWGNISGETASTYSFATATTDNNKQYRAVWTNIAGTANSNAAILTVNAVPVLSSGLTATATSGTAFAYTAASSTPGTSFAWSRATVPGISNTTASGNGNINETLLNTTTSPVNVTYVYTLTANGCSNTQNVVVTVNASIVAPAITTQPATQTRCAGVIASFTSAASGSPAPTVQWQVSTNGGTSWGNISGATASTYSFATATADNNKQYRAVWTNIAGTANSNAAILTVNAVPVLSSGLTATATSGTAFAYTAASSTPGTSFAWSRATVPGISNTTASGNGNINETLLNTTTSPVNVTYVYTLIANGCSNTQNLVVTVNASIVAPAITTQPTTQTRCAGVNASFTSAASGSPAPTVQWQVSTNGGTNWSNISGATTSTYSFATTTADNNKQYRAVWTNSGGTINSNAATLTVTALAVLSSGLTSSATSGSAFTYTATSSTTGTTFAWSRATVTGISNAAANGSGNISEILINTTTSAVNVTYVYTLTANGCSNTQNVVVTVNASIVAPAITTQPTTQTRCAGVIASFTSAASGSPAPTVQWQVSTNGGTNWSNISGATASTYSFATTTADNNKRYRAVWTNTGGTSNSSAAILTVNPTPVLSSSLTANATSGTAFTYTATSSTTGTTFAWSRAAVTGISNTAANGTGNISETLLNTTASSVNVTYVYTLTANGCTNTQNVVVTVAAVTSVPAVTTQPAAQTRCAGTSASFTSAASGTPAPTVQWQVSTNGGFSYSNISGATNSTLTFVTTTTDNNRRYRAVWTNVRGSVNSSSALLTVNAIPSAPTVSVTNNCGNSVLTATGTGSLLWNTGATTSSITVTTAGTYTVTRTVNGCSSTAASAVAAPRVLPVVSSNLAAAVTTGNVFTYTPTSVTTGTTFAWSRAAVTGISNAAATGTNGISETLTNTTGAPVNVTYVYTLTANGCTNTQNLVVTVNPIYCVINGAITSSFNSTSIPAGRYIWFNSALDRGSLTGITGNVTFNITNGIITFTANSQQYTLNVPNARIRYDAAVTSATTQFVNNVWETVMPRTFTDYVFMSGLSYQVPASLPGSITNVRWSATITIDKAAVSATWKWSAAVYTSFAAHSGLNIKPKNGSTQNPYANNDLAGTPENFKTSLVSGAKGSGGTNYTGTYSTTSTATCTISTGTRPAVTEVADPLIVKEIPTTPVETTGGEELNIAVLPNPTSSSFNLIVNGKRKGLASVKVIDISGRVVERHEKVPTNGLFRLGQRLAAGSYLIEVVQDDHKKIIRVIKVN